MFSHRPMSQARIDYIQMAWLKMHKWEPCLHVGCGGKYLKGCVNIDPNPDRPKVDYRYDVHDMPFEDASFDSVLSCHVIPALRDPWRAFREMARVLRPGGAMAHVIPDNSYAPERHSTHHPWDYQHFNWYHPDEFKSDFLREVSDMLRLDLCEHFPWFRFSFRVRAYRL